MSRRLLMPGEVRLDTPLFRHRLGFPRPTVCAEVVVIVSRGVLLIKSAKATRPRSFMFPQGGVEDGETLRGALARELSEECGYGPDHLDLINAELVGFYPSPNACGGYKTLFGVRVLLKSWKSPVLNGENRSWRLAESLSSFCAMVADCSDHKRAAMIQFLTQATFPAPRRYPWSEVPDWVSTTLDLGAVFGQGTLVAV